MYRAPGIKAEDDRLVFADNVSPLRQDCLEASIRKWSSVGPQNTQAGVSPSLLGPDTGKDRVDVVSRQRYQGMLLPVNGFFI